MNVQRWGWLMIWGGIVAFIGIVVLFGHFAHITPWGTVDEKTIEGYRHWHCEIVNTKGFFLQFHNFWSNSAYLAAGLLILWFNDSPPGRVIGALLCFLSFGSAWFHGTLTETGQTMDIAGVYAVLLAIISYGFIELVPWFYHELRTWILMIATVPLGFVASFLRFPTPPKHLKGNFFDSDRFTTVLVSIIIGYMVIAPFVRKSALGSVGWPAAIAVGAGLLALVCKFSDGDHSGGCFYGPSSIIQGHALWHVLSAIMFVGMFEYFRSIRGRSPSVFSWRRG